MAAIVPEGLVRALAGARSVVALTGAGVSAESGVPTFRDAQSGLWARFRPEDLATPEAFARDPALVSRWYDERRERLAGVRPNAGHVALAAIERAVVARGGVCTILTQNVDRLHQAAGSRNVVELHGSLWVWRCVRCGREGEDRAVPFAQHPPHCLDGACGGMRRPGVVWFGEALPESALRAAEEAVRKCDLFLSLGTSAVVWPAAGLAHAARARGARVAEINPEATPLTGGVDWAVQARSGEALPELAARAFGGILSDLGEDAARGRPFAGGEGWRGGPAGPME